MDCINRPKLRGLIAEKGYNLTTLSEATGITRIALSNIMHGHTPNYKSMKSIARALEMTPELAGHIFFGADLRDT